MRKEVRTILKVETLNPKTAWVSGFHASDGCITNPTREGDKRTFSYTVNSKDRDVLVKLANIYDTDAEVKDYHNNQDRDISILRFVSEDNTDFYDELDLKAVFPKVFLDKIHNRHYLRGLFDGDGCLHHRKRKGLMLIFVNMVEEIVERFAYSVTKYTGIGFKTPKRVEKDNLYRIQYESREARLLAWYMYYGDISTHSLDRKRNEYIKCVTSNHPLDQLFECFFGKDLRYTPKMDDNGMYIPVSHGPGTDSLKVCKSLQMLASIFNITITPVYKNKGQYKYYMPYIRFEDAKNINMLRIFCKKDEGIVHV